MTNLSHSRKKIILLSENDINFSKYNRPTSKAKAIEVQTALKKMT